MTDHSLRPPKPSARQTGSLGRLGAPFSAHSFDLLEQLHFNPTNETYQAIRDDLRLYVEEPFQRLIQLAVRLLPRSVTEVMATEKRVFSRFVKNDLGQDSVRDHYWGAFFPKGGRHTEDAQLSLWINFKRLEIGFYIGNYGTKSRQRFQRNCQLYADLLLQLFDPLLVEGSILLGARDNFDVDNGSVVVKQKISWRDWLRDPALGDYDASLILPRSQVLKQTEAQIVQEVSMTFQKLFPLVLLAVSDDPLPAIAAYLGEDGVEEIIPSSEYPLQQLAEDSEMDPALLQEWLAAIDRKKQAVLYGPPGAGKTYLARLLARHMVGGSDGFYELVQLHPAMTYTDFIRGVQTPGCIDDVLVNPQPSGRFVEFCAQARSRRGRCVLILDEMQRCDLSSLFGELVYLLENREEVIRLSDGTSFSIPENVFVLGTLNSAGQADARIDYALRRRFAFLALQPDSRSLISYHQRRMTGFPAAALAGVLQDLNREIGDWRMAVGCGPFLREDLALHLASIWKTEIEPYLELVFPGQVELRALFSWASVAKRLAG